MHVEDGGARLVRKRVGENGECIEDQTSNAAPADTPACIMQLVGAGLMVGALSQSDAADS